MSTLRAELYHYLAEMLADEIPSWLAFPGRDWPLFNAVLALTPESTAARRVGAALLQIEGEPLEGRRARYARVFIEPGRRSLEMYEAGALRGRLLTPETLAVEQWYRQAGLEIDGAEMPDHASLELSFLAYLSGREPGDTSIESAFLHQHAGRWLPALGRTIAASGDPVYSPAGHLLADWLEEVCCQLSVPGHHPVRNHPHPSSTRRRLPYLMKSDACTLCSFCVQVCPNGALSIAENDRSTDLVLIIERCTGCTKCQRVCPVQVLAVDNGAPACQAPWDSILRLRHSERAACKVCGAPTVSQAELAYVAACLDDPDWLDYCPGCRL